VGACPWGFLRGGGSTQNFKPSNKSAGANFVEKNSFLKVENGDKIQSKKVRKEGNYYQP
jgi:hypothetical protein